MNCIYAVLATELYSWICPGTTLDAPISDVKSPEIPRAHFDLLLLFASDVWLFHKIGAHYVPGASISLQRVRIHSISAEKGLQGGLSHLFKLRSPCSSVCCLMLILLKIGWHGRRMGDRYFIPFNKAFEFALWNLCPLHHFR